MNLFGKFLGTDAAVKGVVDVAKSGMDIWNNSDFTAQERTVALLNLIKATASKETSISRRILLWFIIGMNGVAFVIGLIWTAFDASERVDKLIELAEAFKLGWAFVSAVSFYYLTHLIKGGKK